MPPLEQPKKSLKDVIEEVGSYPPEAYAFVQQGLGYAVSRIHGPEGPASQKDLSRHITGQQLCEGLRDYALLQWGYLARTVLRRWNITTTLDFGRIVFALVSNGFMQKTDEDSLEDFRNVYDFDRALERGYRIEADL